MLDVQTRHLPDDVVVLEVTGRVTLGRDCKELEWTTEKLVQENKNKIIFDLSGVTHIDSTGIGIIVMCSGHIKKAGGQLRVVCSPGHVDQVLKSTSVDKVVQIHSTVAGAAASL